MINKRMFYAARRQLVYKDENTEVNSIKYSDEIVMFKNVLF